jgi:hypothetical protein
VVNVLPSSIGLACRVGAHLVGHRRGARQVGRVDGHVVLVLGHTEALLVAASLGLAVLAARPAVIVIAAPLLDVLVALALFKPGTRRGYCVEAVLSARDLGRDVQFGLVLLGLIDRLRFVRKRGLKALWPQAGELCRIA